MRTDKKDFPNRISVGLSNEQLALVKEASDVTGKTVAFLLRKWIEDGASWDVDMSVPIPPEPPVG